MVLPVMVTRQACSSTIFLSRLPMILPEARESVSVQSVAPLVGAPLIALPALWGWRVQHVPRGLPPDHARARESAEQKTPRPGVKRGDLCCFVHLFPRHQVAQLPRAALAVSTRGPRRRCASTTALPVCGQAHA